MLCQPVLFEPPMIAPVRKVSRLGNKPGHGDWCARAGLDADWWKTVLQLLGRVRGAVLLGGERHRAVV